MQSRELFVDACLLHYSNMLTLLGLPLTLTLLQNLARPTPPLGAPMFACMAHEREAITPVQIIERVHA